MIRPGPSCLLLFLAHCLHWHFCDSGNQVSLLGGGGGGAGAVPSHACIFCPPPSCHQLAQPSASQGDLWLPAAQHNVSLCCLHSTSLCECSSVSSLILTGTRVSGFLGHLAHLKQYHSIHSIIHPFWYTDLPVLPSVWSCKHHPVKWNSMIFFPPCSPLDQTFSSLPNASTWICSVSF